MFTVLLLLTACIEYDLRPRPSPNATQVLEAAGSPENPGDFNSGNGGITGHLCDPDGGSGLPGVVVHLVVTRKDIRRDTTDKFGLFSLPDIPGGLYVVVAEAEDGTRWTFEAWVDPGNVTHLEAPECGPESTTNPIVQVPRDPDEPVGPDVPSAGDSPDGNDSHDGDDPVDDGNSDGSDDGGDDGHDKDGPGPDIDWPWSDDDGPFDSPDPSDFPPLGDTGDPPGDTGGPPDDDSTGDDDLCNSRGYWMNHADAWPVTSLTLGDRSYTQAELLAILHTSISGDASLQLAHQLIAVKLDLILGAPGGHLAGTIADADAWLIVHDDHDGLPLNVPTGSSAGAEATDLASDLEAFAGGVCY